MSLKRVWFRLTRKKILSEDLLATQLDRCLSTTDCVFMGVGFMLGAGIFVVTGTMMADKAGPAVFLSYLIAGIVALLNALCYAELSSRFPKAGSGYVYSYISTGELSAFIVGWSMILEYVLSAASVAKGWSSTIDTLAGHRIANFSEQHLRFPNHLAYMGDYPDFLAFTITIVLSLILLTGPKASVVFNNVVTVINIVVLVVAIGIMFSFMNPKTFAEADRGGFLPFGFASVLSAASTGFYSYIGFDGLASCVEEAKDPKKSMPISLTLSVLIVSVLLVFSSLGLALYVPWYTVDRGAAFIAAFQQRHLWWAATTVGYGSLFGITAALFTSLYSLPRVIYAMATDGLIFRCLGNLTERTRVPWIAILLFGCITGSFTIFFDIKELADFLSIGTLITYSMVNATVVVMRFQKPDLSETQHSDFPVVGTLKPRYKNFPLLSRCAPSFAVYIALVVFTVCSICALLSLLLLYRYFLSSQVWLGVVFVVFLAICAFSVFVMSIHEQDTSFDSFQIKYVPLIPCVCMVFNFILILNLGVLTWVRYFVWLAIGLCIYAGYGFRHSSMAAEKEEKEEKYLLLQSGSSPEARGRTDSIEKSEETKS